MDFVWKRKQNYNSQPAIGYLDTYEAIVGIKKNDNFKVRAEVQYYPFSIQKNADATLYFEGDPTNLTDALFSSIRFDISELIREKELEIYPKNSEPLRVFMIKVYTCSKLPEIQLFTHGDMGFSDQLQ